MKIDELKIGNQRQLEAESGDWGSSDWQLAVAGGREGSVVSGQL